MSEQRRPNNESRLHATALYFAWTLQNRLQSSYDTVQRLDLAIKVGDQEPDSHP
jgi:hypothetical protein